MGCADKADLLLGRQSGRRLAAPLPRRHRERLAAAARDRGAFATRRWPMPTRPAPPGCPARSSAAISAPTCRRSMPNIKRVTCPFTGEVLAAVPAHRPDVAVIHAQKADRAGNVLIEGIARRAERSGAGREALDRDGRGDRRRLRPDRSLNAVILPHWTVGACRRGAGRRVPVLCAGLLPAQQRLLQAVGRDLARARQLPGLDEGERAGEGPRSFRRACAQDPQAAE